MNKDNTVSQAGGFMIQLMPGASDEIIDKLEARFCRDYSHYILSDAGNTPEMILDHILGEFGLEINEKVTTEFYCNGTKQRVEKALVHLKNNFRK